MNEIDRLEDDNAALNRGLAETRAMTRAFDSELREMRVTLGDTTRDLGKLDAGFSRGLKRAVDGVVLDGARLSDVLQGLGTSMVNTAYNAAMKPVTNHFGGLLANGLNSMVSGMMPFAKGGAFSGGRQTAFAKGGVVSGPTTFPMRGGTGLMGEAGPEAIMPLTRTPDGRLGVAAAQGGANVNVTMNISTPDVQGFRRSQGQIAAQLSRMVGQGNRNR